MTDEDLEIRTVQTYDSRYKVDYLCLKGPYDKQVATFAAYGLKMPSPTQVRYTQVHQDIQNKDNRSLVFSPSRTNMDVVNMPEIGRIALVEGSIISQQYGGDDRIVAASRKYTKCVIVEKNDIQGRDRLYHLLKDLESSGSACIIEPGYKKVSMDNFCTDPLTNFLYGNGILETNLHEIGEWMKKFGTKILALFFDSIESLNRQSGIYINKLWIAGPYYYFYVCGEDLQNLDEDKCAIGVRFTPRKKKFSRKK